MSIKTIVTSERSSWDYIIFSSLFKASSLRSFHPLTFYHLSSEYHRRLNAIYFQILVIYAEYKFFLHNNCFLSKRNKFTALILHNFFKLFMVLLKKSNICHLRPCFELDWTRLHTGLYLMGINLVYEFYTSHRTLHFLTLFLQAKARYK